MAYTKQTWHDKPATDTPATAARLGHMEDGIAAALTALVPTATKTAAYTAAAGEYVLTDTTSAAVPVTLPTAPPDQTRIGAKMLVKGGTNTTTVTCGGSDHFNTASGGTTFTLTLVNQAAIFQYNAGAATWVVQSDDLPLGQLDGRFQAVPTSGTLAARPATPAKGDAYLATDTAGGTLYEALTAGSWTQVAAGVSAAGLTAAAISSGSGYLSLRNDFGLDPTNSASSLRTAINSAITTAIAAGKGIDLGADMWPISGGPITIPGSLSIRTEGASEVWDNVVNSGLTGMPGAAPWVQGGGFMQMTAATDVVQITGTGATVHIPNGLVLTFGPTIAFNNTGHGIWARGAAVTGGFFNNGPTGCVWNNVIVFGHDGNHYAFYTVNMNLSLVSHARGYGGGGWYEEVNSTNSNYGNTTLVEPYFCVFVSGTADGYNFTANASAPGLPGLLNLNVCVRPQANFQTAATPLTTAFTMTTPPNAAAQQLWRESGTIAGCRMIEPDLESPVVGGVYTYGYTKGIGFAISGGSRTIWSDKNNVQAEGKQTNLAPVANPTGHDNTSLGFNALNAGLLGTTNYNTVVGSKALQAISATAAGSNVAIGYNAMGTGVVSSGTSIAIGTNALENNTTGSNVAIGLNTLRANTTGSANTAIGDFSLNANTTGASNTAIGGSAMLSNTTGGNNVAIGLSAFRLNTTGVNCTAVGVNALTAHTTGNGHTAVGYNALTATTTGFANTAVGVSALAANTTASNSTGIGNNALLASTGGNNTALGSSAGGAITSGSNVTAIGNAAGNTDGTTATTATITHAVLLGVRAQATTSRVVVLGSALSGERSSLTIGCVGSAANLGSGVGALIAMNNADTVPSTNHPSGGHLYVEAGYFKLRSGSGNIFDTTRQAAQADTSGATLAALETEVNGLKAKLRAMGAMA